MLDYDESPLTPPDTVSNARANNYHRLIASPSSIQMARERLRRSFEETEAVNRVDSVMASRSRFQVRTGGSESVINGAHLRGSNVNEPVVGDVDSSAEHGCLWQGNQSVGNARDYRYSSPLVDVGVSAKTLVSSNTQTINNDKIIETATSMRADVGNKMYVSLTVPTWKLTILNRVINLFHIQYQWLTNSKHL